MTCHSLGDVASGSRGETSEKVAVSQLLYSNPKLGSMGKSRGDRVKQGSTLCVGYESGDVRLPDV